MRKNLAVQQKKTDFFSIEASIASSDISKAWLLISQKLIWGEMKKSLLATWFLLLDKSPDLKVVLLCSDPGIFVFWLFAH